MMKLNVNGLMATLLILVSLTWFGCNKCKDVTCLNGGSCDEETGECVCAAGYGGADCGVEDPNRKFSGSYVYSGFCQPQNGTIPDTIVFSPKEGTVDEVLVTGIYGDDTYKCIATVNSDGNTLNIERQFFQNNSVFMVESDSLVFSNDQSIGGMRYKAFIQSSTTPSTDCSGPLGRL